MRKIEAFLVGILDPPRKLKRKRKSFVGICDKGE